MHLHIISTSGKICCVLSLIGVYLFVSQIQSGQKSAKGDFAKYNDPVRDLFPEMTATIRSSLTRFGPKTFFLKCNDVFNDNYNKFIKPYMNKLDNNGILKLKGFNNGEENKYAFIRQNDSRECVHVTLGIGGTIKAEQELKKLYPKCKFYGADPMPVAQIYKQIGEYFPIAVAADSGLHKGIFLKNGSYSKGEMETTGFNEFITDLVREKYIDHLWIDNEGPEYTLLPVIFKEQLLRNPSYVICQLNVEMHKPFSDYSVNTTYVNDLIINFATNSPFVMIHAEAPCDNSDPESICHNRYFAVNIVNEYCRSRYFTLS